MRSLAEELNKARNNLIIHEVYYKSQTREAFKKSASHVACLLFNEVNVSLLRSESRRIEVGRRMHFSAINNA